MTDRMDEELERLIQAIADNGADDASQDALRLRFQQLLSEARAGGYRKRQQEVVDLIAEEAR